MNRSTIITLIILALILLLCALVTWRVVTRPASDGVEGTAADAALGLASSTVAYTDQYGNDAGLGQYTGQVIVAHSWATWVPGIERTLRDLVTLQSQYDNVTVLAVNRAEPVRQAQAFLQQQGLTGLQLLSDPSDQFFAAIGGQSMPETVFYDTTGTIVHHERGSITLGELQTYTQAALDSGEDG